MDNKKLQNCYYSVFSSSEDGEVVLCDILSLLGFFSNTGKEREVDGLSVANTILSRLGLFSEEGALEYTKTILKGSKPYPEEDDNENNNE